MANQKFREKTRENMELEIAKIFEFFFHFFFFKKNKMVESGARDKKIERVEKGKKNKILNLLNIALIKGIICHSRKSKNKI